MKDRLKWKKSSTETATREPDDNNNDEDDNGMCQWVKDHPH